MCTLEFQRGEGRASERQHRPTHLHRAPPVPPPSLSCPVGRKEHGSSEPNGEGRGPRTYQSQASAMGACPEGHLSGWTANRGLLPPHWLNLDPQQRPRACRPSQQPFQRQRAFRHSCFRLGGPRRGRTVDLKASLMPSLKFPQ